jgi:heterotetrameric sarcosine oxidase gamma subunit
VPIDLRASVFGEHSCARTLCQHITVALRRDGEGFEIMAFRSMAATLVHEIADAMAAVAARGATG